MFLWRLRSCRESQMPDPPCERPQCFSIVSPLIYHRKSDITSTLHPTRSIVTMLLYLWCLWISGILTVHAAAQHPSDREEEGALRSWRRQNVGTPTPEPARGPGVKLSGRRPPLSGWAEGKPTVVGFLLLLQKVCCSSLEVRTCFCGTINHIRMYWSAWICLFLWMQ